MRTRQATTRLVEFVTREQPVPPSFSPLVLQHLRMTFMSGNHIGFVALYLV